MTPRGAPWLSVDFSRVSGAGEASVALMFPRSHWCSDWRLMFVLTRFVCLAHNQYDGSLLFIKNESRTQRRVVHYYPCRRKTSQLELINKASVMIDSPRMKDIRTLISFMVLVVYWSEHRCFESVLIRLHLWWRHSDLSSPFPSVFWICASFMNLCDSLLFISRVIFKNLFLFVSFCDFFFLNDLVFSLTCLVFVLFGVILHCLIMILFFFWDQFPSDCCWLAF